MGEAACAGATGRLWRVSGWAGNGDGLVKDVFDFFLKIPTSDHSTIFVASRKRSNGLKLAFSTVVAASQSNGLFFTLLGSAPRCESVPFLMVRSGRRYAPRRLQGRTRWGVIPFGTEPFFLLPEPNECNSECLMKRRKTSGSRKKDSQALVTDAAVADEAAHCVRLMKGAASVRRTRFKAF